MITPEVRIVRPHGIGKASDRTYDGWMLTFAQVMNKLNAAARPDQLQGMARYAGTGWAYPCRSCAPWPRRSAGTIGWARGAWGSGVPTAGFSPSQWRAAWKKTG